MPARPNPFNANLALLAILGILQNSSFIYGIQDDLDECNFDLWFQKKPNFAHTFFKGDKENYKRFQTILRYSILTKNYL